MAGGDLGRRSGDFMPIRDDRSCHAVLDSEIAASDFVLARARLMRSLALGGWPAVLDSVEKAVEHRAALDLPREVAERLKEELTASLDDAGSQEQHSRLLMGPEIPEPYRSWAVACAVRLAVALVTAEVPGLELPLRRLGEIWAYEAQKEVIAEARRVLEARP